MTVHLSDTEEETVQKGATLKPSQAEGKKMLNLSIDAMVIRRAKLQAVRRGVSLSSVVNDYLTRWTARHNSTRQNTR